MPAKPSDLIQHTAALMIIKQNLRLGVSTK